MLPRNIFETLHTVMAILVLFEQFLSKGCMFLTPNFECFTNDAMCSLSFDYECSRRLRHIVTKKFEIMEKFYSSKALLKMAVEEGMHTQHRPTPHLPWIRHWLYNNKKWLQILEEMF